MTLVAAALLLSILLNAIPRQRRSLTGRNGYWESRYIHGDRGTRHRDHRHASSRPAALGRRQCTIGSPLTSQRRPPLCQAKATQTLSLSYLFCSRCRCSCRRRRLASDLTLLRPSLRDCATAVMYFLARHSTLRGNHCCSDSALAFLFTGATRRAKLAKAGGGGFGNDPCWRAKWKFRSPGAFGSGPRNFSFLPRTLEHRAQVLYPNTCDQAAG